MPHHNTHDWRTPTLVIMAGCLIAMLGLGVRSSFGLFLEPMVNARGWDHTSFSLAIASQNLLWGFCVPVASAIADRYGPARVLFVGALIYAASLLGMAEAATPGAFYLAGGVLAGIGIGFTSFSIALAVMASVASPEKRSMVLGIGTAMASLGQVVFSPLGDALITHYGWHYALIVFAVFVALIAPLALVLPSPASSASDVLQPQSLRGALREALGHRGYVLLTIGFFVCGFHVAFIGVHFPAYVTTLGLSSEVGAYALALIGLFNIIGSLGAGYVGQRFSMKSALAVLYFVRALVITGLIIAPKTQVTIYLFAAAMGLLWLGTIPLTTGIVARIFGVRYVATLFGVVFVSHQLGSFIGIWLGGYLYDLRGNYDLMWYAGVVLGVAAAVIHIPINEQPLPRLRQTASA